MGELKQSVTLPGGVIATLVARSTTWWLTVVIQGPDARYSPGVALLYRRDVDLAVTTLQSAADRMKSSAYARLPGHYSEALPGCGRLGFTLEANAGRIWLSVSASSDTYTFERELTSGNVEVWIRALAGVAARGEAMQTALQTLEAPVPVADQPTNGSGTPEPEGTGDNGNRNPAWRWEELYRVDCSGMCVVVQEHEFAVSYDDIVIPGWGRYPRVPTLTCQPATGGRVAVRPLGRSPSAGYYLTWEGVPSLGMGNRIIRPGEAAFDSHPAPPRDLVDVFGAAMEAFTTRFGVGATEHERSASLLPSQ